ncbi:phage tail tape measure protein [Candidimonas humi]|uniref:Phage tail tape measure protein n=1 Tax=Candidimonas humi TaxID=683355 RepID=A0ABV8NVY7_9BURK|nr:phage tail tape measure protein [Candidimonas humi]MBV6304940.1 phage tail tape measure protein [Candidimonas humi]
MADDAIGTARIDITVDASTLQAGITSAKGALSSFSTQAQAAFKGASSSAKSAATSLNKWITTQETLNISINRAEASQRLLNAAMRDVPVPVIEGFRQRINALADAQEKASAAAGKGSSKFNQYGKSVGEVNMALRGVPAQLTDIVVGLQGGQRPLTVLLQQGGQLKDMFGGIRPAAEALGGALLKLVNPYTVAAAAAAGLALAYKQGSDEQEAFSKSLILTGNVAGLTAVQLSGMAAQIGTSVDSTTHAAAAALNTVVSSGKIAPTAYREVAAAALEMSDATGQSIDKIIAQFETLNDKPADAIAKLNDQQHFLSAATYEQIKALQDQGREQEAAALAQSTYANAVHNQAVQIEAAQGTLERAWDSLGKAAKGAWDAMLNIGRPTPVDELKAQADALRKQIAALGANPDASPDQDFASNAGGAAFGNPNIVPKAQKLQAQLRAINARITADDLDEDDKRRAAAAQAAQDAKINAKQWLDSEMKGLQTRKENRDKEIADFKRYAATYGLTATQIADGIARINKKYEQKGGGTNAGNSLLEAAKQQTAALQSQLDALRNGYAKLTPEQQKLAKDQQLFNDLASSKAPLTAADKQKLAMKDLVLAQDQINVAKAEEIQKIKDAAKLDALRAANAQALANDLIKYSNQLAGMTLGQTSKQQLTDQQQISLEILRQQQQYTKQFASGSIDKSTYDAFTTELQKNLQDRLAANASYYARLKDLQSSWSQGAIGGLNSYAEDADNVFDGMKSAATNAFKGMEDVFVNFVTTGKLSFTDLANSIISDLARIAIRQSLTGPLASGLSSALGSLFGPLAGVSASPGLDLNASLGTSMPGTPGVDWMSYSLHNAHGNVFDNPSLSAYSNGIYDRPHYFAFAKGAGVFGEAGPEAIMPLTRMSNGNLGVRSDSGNSAPNVQIQFVNQTSQPAQAKVSSPTFNGKDWVVQVVLTDLQTGGRIRKQMQALGAT